MNANEAFERDAEQFRKDTGIWPPGKDRSGAAGPIYEMNVRLDAYRYWQKQRGLQAENAKLRERIESMTVNGLSPESRLAGYSVVADKQTERIRELCAENAKLKEEKEKLREAIQAALRIKDVWTLPMDESCFEDEAKAIQMMEQKFWEALKE